MNTQFLIPVAVTLAGISSCALNAPAPAKITPVDEVLVAYKRAMVSAQDANMFEELVKFKELGSTFNLYLVKTGDVEVSTTATSSQSKETKGQLSIPAGGQVGLNVTIGVSSQQVSKTHISLEPLANDPETYGAIKKAFEKTPGRGMLYDVIYYDQAKAAYSASGSPLQPDEVGERCNKETHCFRLGATPEAPGRVAYAYLKDVRAFRKLIDEISELPPPPKPKPRPDAKQK